jgi:putative IMPACT (imprinted ancient) family translation regulator
VVVVVRYYGGTNLGKGGLIRGYGGAAAAAIASGAVVSVRETQQLTVGIPYSDHGAVQGVLRRFELQPSAERFDTQVSLTLDVPTEDVDALRQAINDKTAGRADIAPR